MTTTASPALATGSYRIDPATSTIRFRTTHLLGLGPVEGTFGIRQGSVHIAQDPLRSRVEVTVDAASFHTDKARRDKDITGRRFLDAGKFPDIVFHGTEVRPDTDGGWELDGSLTVRGRFAPVSLRVTSVEATTDGLRGAATARIDRYAHGVNTGRGVVGRFLDVTFEVRATRVANQ